MSNQISFLLLIFLYSFVAAASSIDTLKVSESLNFNQTLISPGKTYEAGFFIPPGSEPDKIYLGIWYYNLSDPKTVVWVGNRDKPARNSSVALMLKSDGSGQIVMTWNGVEVWASNKSASNVVSPFVQLLDTGNLVVREANSNDDYVWQSFDYPTDTLLPDQKLGWTRKTGLDRRLISWKGISDPASGNYSLNLTRTGDPDLFVNGGSETIYRTGPYVGQGLSGIPAMKPNTGMNFTLSDTPFEVYYMYSLIDLSIRSRLVMGQNGLLYRYTWVPEHPHWNPFWYHPEVPCDKYMACGPYGVCDDRKLFGCVCPHGFVPTDTTAVSLRDATSGCVRRTGLECGTDGFWVMGNMKLPMSETATVDSGKTLEECEHACKKDCNCTAYASARVVDGVRSGCVTWTGDLLDMRTFGEGGHDLYVRLAAADLSTNKHDKFKIFIGVSVVVATIILAIAAYFVRKAKHKPGDQSDWEIGGVFNGVQEIAIKRLSKESIQGFDEFKNEVNLIAKLQHRNLVRLLGYCVEKEEKMLIYEYLRNRSLDFILFDDKGAKVVDPSIRDSYELYEVLKCIQIGLLCVQAEPIERPTMSSVVLMLSSKTTTLPQPTLPGFYLGWNLVSETDSNPSQRDESIGINQLTVTMIDGR
ncbi:hypothetical protein V2J09_001374 [Rumex salicifolius]